MELIHTLLFMLRPARFTEDIRLAQTCLHSLEKSAHKTLLVYNQGPLSNEALREFLRPFDLTCIVIGGAYNAGITVGRQRSFAHIWENFPEVRYISETHLDMRFAPHWETPLTDYLERHDEPVVGCGIVDKDGAMHFSDRPKQALPTDDAGFDDFLTGLRHDAVVHGFTHPCIHRSETLQAVGGYDTRFLTGKQCFEDDSLLLGYYYYYGTRANWYPKVNYRSVVYHAVALQRMDLQESIMPNYNGLVRQYGAMGQQHLAYLHRSAWHKRFFSEKFTELIGQDASGHGLPKPDGGAV